MTFSGHKYLFLAAFLVISAAAIPLNAQDESESKPPEDVTIMAGYQMSLTGIHTKYNIQLVDRESGFAYDVFTLAKEPSVQHAASLSDEQLSKIQMIKAQFVGGLSEQFFEMVADEGSRDTISDMFASARDEAWALMTEEQRQSFQHAAARHGIQQVGWNKYVAGMCPEMELSAEDLATLDNCQVNANTASEKKRNELLADANRELLRQLPESARKRLESEFGSEAMDSWCKHIMFTTNSKAQVSFDSVKSRGKKIGPQNYARLLAYSKKARTKLKMDDEQTEEVEAIHREFAKTSRDWDEIISANQQVRQVLSDDQYRQLRIALSNRLAKQKGTVTDLVFGELSQAMELTPEQQDRVFEAGRDIYKKLKEDVIQLKNGSRHDFAQALSNMDPETRKRILKLVGNASE